jgi:hypothetical protein
MISQKLKSREREILESCPNAGTGVHKWLFIAALKLHRSFSDKNHLAQVLAEATAKCGRDVPSEEIRNAVQNSLRIVDGSSETEPGYRRWPGRNSDKIKEIVSSGLRLSDLESSSPKRWTDGSPHTEEIIDELFPGNPLLCAGPTKTYAITQPKSQWLGRLEKQQFIVSSPMSAQVGLTKAGTESMRCLANVGPRRFLVVEFDQGSFDAHAALLAHLGNYAPLVLAVHSGNKSLHGWFFAESQPEEKIQRFFRYAVSLGADSATWTPCQFVRMPDGHRENGVRQRVIFFHPKPCQQ